MSLLDRCFEGMKNVPKRLRGVPASTEKAGEHLEKANKNILAAKLMSDIGIKIVGVSDSTGGVYSSKGLDVVALMRHKCDTNSVRNFPGSDNVTNEELLELPCEILCPSALAGVITEKNAPRIKAKFIVEGANGPTTPEADQVMRKRKIFVIPDFLASAGGVTCSYFEQVQSNMNYFWEKDEVLGKLDVKMTAAFRAAYDLAKKRNLGMRDAAYCIAISRVSQACKDRGWI